MRHRQKGKILSRETGPRRALIRGLARNLILVEQMKTTEAKAKVLRPFVERLLHMAKENNLVVRRRLQAVLQDRQAVKKLLEVFGPKYKDRQGGYVKIFKIGPRKGDAAKMAIVKLV